jgi:ABC-2 type transport system permease protein
VRTLRALPTLFRVGFAEAIAYRAEMLVWVLATTMPLIMLVLWTAVAEAGPVIGQGGGTWGSGRFVAYFLSAFIVRQLISSWASWEINYEVRQGVLSMRLLRPLHPVVSFAAMHLAYSPLRAAVAAPVAVIIAVTSARAFMSADMGLWGLWVLSLIGGWAINFFANVAIGAMSFYLESSIKLMEVWMAFFFVFSGYLYPLDLFPGWLAAAAKWMPFRYQLGLPVELMTGAHTVSEALPLLATQWAWAAGFAAFSLLLWRSGVRRFQAFGG